MSEELTRYSQTSTLFNRITKLLACVACQVLHKPITGDMMM